MASLWNQRNKKSLLSKLRVAESLSQRMKGLLGLKHLPEDEGLWIQHCSSVHTYFMHFPIDVVFVDRALVVQKVVCHLQPNRLAWSVWRTQSVFEMAAGVANKCQVQVGDQLYVVD